MTRRRFALHLGTLVLGPMLLGHLRLPRRLRRRALQALAGGPTTTWFGHC